MKASKIYLMLLIGAIVANPLVFQGNSSADNTTTTTNTPNDIYLTHGFLEVTSDQQLEDLAQKESWSGDGSKKHPFVVENYIFDQSQNGSDIFDQAISGIYYIYPGFTTFNLIMQNINLHVKLQNNQFTFSVLIVNSPNVDIIGNEWINPSNPSNLFVSSSENLIRDNFFGGNNLECTNDTQAKPFPRVVIKGPDMEVVHNLFDIDKGCHRIVQMLVIGIGGKVQYNLFRTSDIAIEMKTGKVEVTNNDFEVGDFAIILNNQVVNSTNNNFYSSAIGSQGDQNYTGMIKAYTESFYLPGHESKMVDCYITAKSNYYSNWINPDENHDGIVDKPYSICSPDNGALKINTDATPSTTPFDGYYEYSPNESGLTQNQIIIGLGTIFAIIGVMGVIIQSKKSKPVFNGQLIGKPAEIVKDLFKSQTILYYTLIGQSRIADKELEEEVKNSIPRDFLHFKFLLHPIKLSITKLLYENLEFTSIEIKNILDVSWNDYYTHAGALQKKGYIRVEDEFVDGIKRQMLRLEPKGIEEYKVLTELLHLFLDNSTDYKAYIEVAQRKMETIDRDLYPDN